MPKVTEEYKIKKRKTIIEAAVEVLKQKPLYEITMLDVINEAKLSKGGIYLYFSDIDDLVIQTMNFLMESHEPLVFAEKSLSGDVENDLLNVFGQLGDFIEACPAIISKLRSELVIYINYYPEKMERYKTALAIQQDGDRFMEMTSKLIKRGIQQKIFRQDVAIEVIMMNISIYLNGISDAVVRSILYKTESLSYPLKEYLVQFIRGVILSLK